MRLLLYCIFTLSLLQSAEVDKRFFALESKKLYIEEIKHKIAQNTESNLSQLESVLLDKIEQLDSKKIVINYEKRAIDNNKTISIDPIKKRMKKLIEAQKELAIAQNKITDIASKLDYTKQEIEEIVSEDKYKELSYQLQYTLYQLVINREKTKIQRYEEYITYTMEQLGKVLPLLDTHSYTQMLKELNTHKRALEHLETQKIALDTKMEREALVEESNTSQKNRQQHTIEEQVHKKYLTLLEMSFDRALMELALGEEVAFYKSLKNAKSYFSLLNPTKVEEAELYHAVLKELAKTHFGVTSMVVSASQASFLETLQYLWNLLFKPLFVFNEKAITSADILKILTIIIVGFMLASFYRRKILRWSKNWVNATPMTARLSANIGYYFLIFITFIIALSSIGLDLSSFSMFASALAIGIGFGLQTVVSNMVAGIIMMFERSIRIGDVIELSNGVMGTVTDMRIRSTVMKTFDNIDVVVPNSTFIQGNVINLTLDDSTRRLHIPFGVGYGTEVEIVKEVIIGGLQASELNYYEDEKRQPSIKMVAMGANSVDYELLVWIDAGNKKQPAPSVSDFLIFIYQALNKHKIEIPFPQLDIHLKSKVETKS